MRNPFCRCELNAVQALAGIAFVAIALFSWAVGAQVVVQPPDADVASVANPLWQLWQLGALVISFAGVWQLWFGTRRVAWTRSLALGLYALAIFVNAYTGGFGDYTDALWLTVNPLFIAFGSVAAVALWRCGCAAGRVGAAVWVVLGIVVFVNAYFVNNGVVWQIMNPLMMLAALAGAGGAVRANVAPLNAAT